MRKYFYCLSFTIAFVFNSSGQSTFWQTAIYNSDDWRYFRGVEAVSNNWKNIDFDDSNWNIGQGSIGYGDGDDATIIDPVMSLYMRKVFTVSDKSKVIVALFNADYDDGFVAYLNGVEIARENVAELNPGFNSNTIAEHEAQLYQGGAVSYYFISTDLQNILVNGENVLAIQTLNRNGFSSSDLTSSYWLSFSSTESNLDFGPLPEFIISPDFESTLPIVKINTNGEEIPNEPKIIGDIEIIWNQFGNINSSLDAPNEFVGDIRIEKRGQTSLFLFPKNSYSFETIDSEGEDQDVSFLNFPSEEDFILHGPYSDKTLMRNVLIFDVANKMGQYASRTRFVDLEVNGSYEGIYILMEQIKRDKNRVDIAKLRVEDIAGDELTGGYIIKIDKDAPDWYSNYDVATAPGKKLQYQYVYPRRTHILPAQAAYIQSYIDSFELSMLNTESFVGGKNFLDFIDIESFVDHFLLVEFAMDIDAYRFSTYMHKDKDSNGGKLKCGPLWDFNLSFGNVDFCEGWNTSGFMYNRHCDQGNPFWWGRLMVNEVFRNHAKCRWQELRNGVLHRDSLYQFIEDQADLLDSSLGMNYQRWPILEEWVWPNAQVPGSYNGELAYLKGFINDRLQWMDNNLFGICDSTLVINPEPGFDYVLLPNPVTESAKLIFDKPFSPDMQCRIFDMLGRELPIEVDVISDRILRIDVSALSPGVYNLIIQSAGVEHSTKQFVLIN